MIKSHNARSDRVPQEAFHLRASISEDCCTMPPSPEDRTCWPFQAYAEKALASGTAPKGFEQAFAATLQISPNMWSQIKLPRPIGEKLSRQIERLSDKPIGWLNESRKDIALSTTEASFLDLALEAWRATNSVGRKALRERLKALVGGSP